MALRGGCLCAPKCHCCPTRFLETLPASLTRGLVDYKGIYRKFVGSLQGAPLAEVERALFEACCVVKTLPIDYQSATANDRC